MRQFTVYALDYIDFEHMICRKNLTDNSDNLDTVDQELQDTTSRIETANNRIEAIRRRVDGLKKAAEDLRKNATNIRELDVGGRLPVERTLQKCQNTSLLCHIAVTSCVVTVYNLLLHH